MIEVFEKSLNRLINVGFSPDEAMVVMETIWNRLESDKDMSCIIGEINLAIRKHKKEVYTVSKCLGNTKKPIKRNNQKETLCWGCKNAIPSKVKNTGCDWSKMFKPVNGWKAKPNKLSHNTHSESWLVLDCPQFARG